MNEFYMTLPVELVNTARAVRNSHAGVNTTIWEIYILAGTVGTWSPALTPTMYHYTLLIY